MEQPAATKARSRARRNVIGSSKNRAVYVRLMEASWTSDALERYAWHRYGEDIPAATFRYYRRTKKIETDADKMFTPPTESMLDVLAERARLLHMQKHRIAIDFSHEEKMNKLFTGNRFEMQLLSDMITSYKADLQDLGLFPKAGDKLEITKPDDNPADIPARRSTLDDLVGQDPLLQADMAKVIHLSQQRTTG